MTALVSNDCLIALLDDDPAVLASVRALLHENGYPASCFDTPEDFLSICPLDSIGCLVTDLRMPGIDGSELQRRLMAAGSTLSMVVVTGHADVPTAVRLMENGALTVLEKPYEDTALLGAVQQALDRSRRIHAAWRWQAEMARRLNELADDERQVMQCLLNGKSNKTIAYELGISLRTVDRRRKAVLEKMRADCVPELAAMLASHRPTERPARWLARQC